MHKSQVTNMKGQEMNFIWLGCQWRRRAEQSSQFLARALLLRLKGGEDMCRGSKSNSKYMGYEWGGKVLATVILYASVYEFRPLSEEVKSPTSRCPEAVDWIAGYMCVL